MPETDDITLLRRFAEGDESAFAVLVERYVHLVYSAAIRQVGNAFNAEEITQAVFIILTQKAKSLSPKTILSGWLYQTARLTAANYLRSEFRRQQRDQEAYMQSTLNEPGPGSWEQIEPLLDEAMGRLAETDRNAIVLRYFENKSPQETAAALKLTEAAERKRVSRALDKLRKFFSRRGFVLSTAVIAGALSANSVQAAPAGLVAAISTTAVKGSAVAASTLTLAKGTIKIMTWMKCKLAIGLGAALLLAGGVATVALSQSSDDTKLTPQEIAKKVQDKYDSLTSYRDEGKEMGSVGATVVPSHKFTIKLARPDLYLVEWEQDMGTFVQKGAVWSAGAGDFVELGGAIKKVSDQTTALATAAGVSGRASASIPDAFFKVNTGQSIPVLLQSATRKGDEKLGDTDCYVLVWSRGEQTQTFWIGKSDFLIRQVESDTSAAAVKAALEAAAKRNPQMNLPTAASGDVKSVETHSNIVVNSSLSKSDFDHQASTGSK